MNDYAFGNFLYELRSERGFSQAQLGELLGVSNKAVSKWENGSAKPNTRLLPQIAEIFGVTVEELFAGKRLEQDPELQAIKMHLLTQKRRLAILSSVFLSVLVMIPGLLVEFVCIVMGFGLPEEVLGPLGAVSFILCFFISVTAFLIYRNHCKKVCEPSEAAYTDRFARVLKRVLLFCAIAFWNILILATPILFLVLDLSQSIKVACIVLLILVFLLILLLGALVFCFHTKRLLKISFGTESKKDGRGIPFPELPLRLKICWIASVVSFPLLLSAQIWSYYEVDGLWIRLVLYAIFFYCVFSLLFHQRKKK